MSDEPASDKITLGDVETAIDRIRMGNAITIRCSTAYSDLQEIIYNMGRIPYKDEKEKELLADLIEKSWEALELLHDIRKFACKVGDQAGLDVERFSGFKNLFGEGDEE